MIAPSLADALLTLDDIHPLIVFCSDDLCDGSLRFAIKSLRKASGAPVVALSRLAEWTGCVEACTAGAFDYIACPPEPQEGRRVLRMAPLHHHFELLGWQEVTIVVRFWLIQGVAVSLGMAIFYAEWVAQ